MHTRTLVFTTLTALLFLTFNTGCIARRVARRQALAEARQPQVHVITVQAPPAATAAPAPDRPIGADDQPADGTEVTEAPPEPIVEVITVAPSPTHVWVGGYWAWHGRWVWAPGRWAVRPHAHAVWAPGHWSRRGHVHVWSRGRWR